MKVDPSAIDKEDNLSSEDKVSPFQDETITTKLGINSNSNNITHTTTTTLNITTSTKYIMLGLLWMTACLSALDRVAMSVALVPMSIEFSYTDTIKGSISSFLSIGYGLSILPSGILAGIRGLSPRLVMMTGIAVWSLATIVTPLAAEWQFATTATTAVRSNTMLMTLMMVVPPLLAARALVGIGESIVLPTTQRLLTEWAPPEEKSRALAFIFSGFQAGTIGAYLLSPILMEQLGDASADWRPLFYSYGAAGLLILLPWLTLAQDSPTAAATTIALHDESTITTPNTTSVSSATMNDNQTKELLSSLSQLQETLRDAPWSEMLRSKAVWAMLLAHAAKNWGTYNALAWTPTFYSEQYGMSVKDSAWLSVLPSLLGATGGFVAGYLADAVVDVIPNNASNDDSSNSAISTTTLLDDDEVSQRRTTNIRKVFQGVGLLGPALFMGILAYDIPKQAWVAQIFLSISFCLMAFHAGGYDAANQEKAGPRWAGLLYSVSSLPAVLAGTGGVYVTGRLLDATNQDWSWVFGLTAVVNALGGLAFIGLYDSKKEFD